MLSTLTDGVAQKKKTKVLRNSSKFSLLSDAREGGTTPSLRLTFREPVSVQTAAERVSVAAETAVHLSAKSAAKLFLGEWS